MKARTFIFLIVLLTVARLLLVLIEQPSPDETYYYLCAQHPAAAYFDGPAATAAMVGTLSKLGLSDFWWRAASPLWALVATLATFGLMRRLSDSESAVIVALIVNSLPIFNVGAIRVGPMLPSFALVLGGLFFCWLAVEAKDVRLHIWWPLTALCFVLAVWFMYAAAFVVPALVVFVLTSRKHRGLNSIGAAVVVLAVAAAFYSALKWNADQQWVALGSSTYQTLWHFEFAGFFRSLAQTGYWLSPLLLAGLFIAWWIAAKGVRVHVRIRFIFLCALPGMLLGCYCLLRGQDAVFFFLLAAPLLLDKVRSALLSRPWAIKVIAGIAVVFSLHAVAVAFLSGPPWPRVTGEVRQVIAQQAAAGHDNLFLIGENPPLASALGYGLRNDFIPPPGHPIVYVRESQAIDSQFGLWPGYDQFVETEKPRDEYFTEQKGENPFVGRSALYFSSESPENLPESITAAFEKVSLLQQLSLGQGRSEPLYIYLCLNYQTLPL